MFERAKTETDTEEMMVGKDQEYYGEYAAKLENTRNMIVGTIQAMLDEISTDSETALAEHVKSRIKSSTSLIRKLEKGGYPTNAESGLENLSDIIGLRVVVHFVGDIYTLCDEIRKRDDWQIVEVKDYIANPKPNGYRSLHLILKIPFDSTRFPDIRVELQLRTSAMDCWASLEHQLQYKKSGNTQLIIEELKRCADEIASIDLSMQTIRDLILLRRD